MSKTRIPAAVRRAVEKESNNCCSYCQSQPLLTGIPLEIDHIIPEAKGGSSHKLNLCMACPLCNQYKSAKLAEIDPESAMLSPLFNPRTQKWAEHFAWTVDYRIILGLTPTGRATVIALKMNNPPMVIARAIWATTGLHPPTIPIDFF